MKLYKIDGEGWRRLVAISNCRVGQPSLFLGWEQLIF